MIFSNFKHINDDFLGELTDFPLNETKLYLQYLKGQTIYKVYLRKGGTDIDTLNTVDIANNPDDKFYENLKITVTNKYIVNGQEGGKSKKLQKCTVMELKENARARQIKGYSTMRKEELIVSLMRTRQ